MTAFLQPRKSAGSWCGSWQSPAAHDVGVGDVNSIGVDAGVGVDARADVGVGFGS